MIDGALGAMGMPDPVSYFVVRTRQSYSRHSASTPVSSQRITLGTRGIATVATLQPEYNTASYASQRNLPLRGVDYAPTE